MKKKFILLGVLAGITATAYGQKLSQSPTAQQFKNEVQKLSERFNEKDLQGANAEWKNVYSMMNQVAVADEERLEEAGESEKKVLAAFMMRRNRAYNQLLPLSASLLPNRERVIFLLKQFQTNIH